MAKLSKKIVAVIVMMATLVLGVGVAAMAETEDTTPHFTLLGHVEKRGTGGLNSINGEVTIGTVGKALRLEAIQVYGVDVQMNAHVQGLGWMGWKDHTAGTEGKALRLEAIQIKLTGDLADEYDIYYRVHVQKIGWMDWAKNGETAGTVGQSLRVEAIELRLVEK